MSRDKHLVVSTCGTSVFTNFVKPGERLHSLLRATANLDDRALDEHDGGAEMRRHLAERARLLADFDIAEARRYSAELNGVLAFYDEQPRSGAGDHHILLTTDTVQGRHAGAAVAAWLQRNGLGAEVYTLEQFHTGSLESFRYGVNELVKWCGDIIGEYRKKGYRIIFNLVGSFKALQAYASTLGALYADEQIYLFEAPGSPLLRIPRLPVRLDAEAVVTQHLRPLRRLHALDELPVAELAGVPETLLEIYDDRALLSPWGRVIFDQSRDALYGQKLLESPSERVRHGHRFEHEARKLDGALLVGLNQRIDDLVVYQHSDHKKEPPGLEVKKLVGNPKPGSTHECRIWSSDGRRLFLSFDGPVVIINELGPHL